MAALCGLTAGCSSSNGPAIPVEGRVSYHSAPLAGGTIVFIPDASRGSSGPLAHASIQADGSYHLQTEGATGAAPGWYRVTVVAVEGFSSSGGQYAPRSLLPEKYRDPDLSGLACEVKPGRENKINFNLD
jgi:hypothetical protein